MSSINSISGLENYQNQLAKITGLDTNSQSTSKTSATSFGDILQNAISTLNNNMNTMDSATNGMVSGTENDLGSVMVKMTEAQLSLETAVQVRNKVVEAYSDIKNMQF